MPRITSIVAPPAPLLLGPPDDGRALAADAYAAADWAEPWAFERVDGRLRLMSPEGQDHVRTSTPWLHRLVAYAAVHPDRVQAVVPAPWVRIDPDNDRIGDIGVYLGGLLADLNLPDQVPDILIEFVSPSAADRRRDYVEKRADYARAGVREYVIVDRFDRRVTVLTLRDGQYEERVVAGDGMYETPLLPGLAIAPAGIWPE